MTRFTPQGFARAMNELGNLTDGLPVPVLAGLGEFARDAMAAASKASGGVDAKVADFEFKKPRASKGEATAKVVGHGFAVLDEYGSYHKPQGYPIDPKFTFKPGVGARQGHVLADGHGFFAAYVNHPPQKAHEYVAKAEPVIQAAVDKAFDKAVAVAITKALH